MSLTLLVDDEDAYLLYKESKSVFKAGGFTSSTLGTTQNLCSGEQKIPGIRWNVAADHYIIDVACLAKQLQSTKRNIVSMVGGFFDPLGFMSPAVIRFKMLFQKLCETKVGWDQVLAGDLVREWMTLVDDLQDGQQTILPVLMEILPRTAFMASAMPQPRLMLLRFI